MRFSKPLSKGKLIKRYKRFLADVELPNQQVQTIHCPNTGSMLNCNMPGCNIWFSNSESPTRKYPHTWELIEIAKACLVGINTHRANDLITEAIENKVIQELKSYDSLRREVKYGEQNSRIDILLEKPAEKCFVEIKNVTLGERHIGYFPDAVTSRGVKHLQELMLMKREGHRAVLCFCVQHSGVEEVRPAKHIDPLYAKTLKEAEGEGVELIAYGAAMSPTEITINKAIPVKII